MLAYAWLMLYRIETYIVHVHYVLDTFNHNLPIAVLTSLSLSPLGKLYDGS